MIKKPVRFYSLTGCLSRIFFEIMKYPHVTGRLSSVFYFSKNKNKQEYIFFIFPIAIKKTLSIFAVRN